MREAFLERLQEFLSLNVAGENSNHLQTIFPWPSAYKRSRLWFQICGSPAVLLQKRLTVWEIGLRGDTYTRKECLFISLGTSWVGKGVIQEPPGSSVIIPAQHARKGVETTLLSAGVNLFLGPDCFVLLQRDFLVAHEQASSVAFFHMATLHPFHQTIVWVMDHLRDLYGRRDQKEWNTEPIGKDTPSETREQDGKNMG